MPTMTKLAERLEALLAFRPEELVGDDLDDLLPQALDEGTRLLEGGLADEAEPLLRQAEALAVISGRFDAARPLRNLLGNLEASRNDDEGALAWYGAVLALPDEAGNPRARRRSCMPSAAPPISG